MTPIRSTELSLRFAGAWSPAWLLLVLPILVLVAMLLLRGQFPDVRRPRSLGLACLRLALLTLVAVLAFRPDIVFTETLTWLGRVIVLVDDSASMSVADPALPSGEALRLARVLDPKLEPREDHDRAERLLAVSDLIGGFEPLSRDGSREDDGFWTRAEAVEQEVTRLLDEAGRSDLLPRVVPLFGGRIHPGGRAFAEVREVLETAAADVRQAGEGRDAGLLAENAAAAAGLAAALDDVRKRSRLDLARAMLERLPAALPEQRLEVVSLSADAPRDQVADVSLGTDIGGRIAALLGDSEDEPGGTSRPRDRGPINALLLVSDGRDTVAPGQPPQPLLARLAGRKTPVITCGAGGIAEPTDLAVLAVSAPPIAVAGGPLTVTTRLKTAIGSAGPASVGISLQAAGSAEPAAELAKQEIAADGDGAGTTVAISFTPPAEDETRPPQRLAVELASIPGEVIPVENNRQEFVLAVRPEPVRVLVLDAVPRWETRFVINTLNRMPFVELNAIVASTRPQGQLVRGVQRGTWPADEATLALYSVLFLGRLPGDMLSANEQEAIDRWVRDGGGTLVELAPTTCPVPTADWRMRRTTVGLVHPLTRLLAEPPLEEDLEHRMGGTAPGPTPLLVTLDPADGPPVPLVSVSRDGAGKRVLITSDDLWRVLNPRNLDAHTALFAELVTWAVLAAAPTSSVEADQPAATSREPISVVLPAASEATEVEVLHDGQLVARVPVRGNTAVVPAQRPGRLQLRIAGTESLSQPVEIVADEPELKLLARDEGWLETLAARSGGRAAGISDLARLVRAIPPRSHVERQEQVWRPWNSGWTVALLAGLLVLEWVWRKWEGLV